MNLLKCNALGWDIVQIHTLSLDRNYTIVTMAIVFRISFDINLLYTQRDLFAY